MLELRRTKAGIFSENSNFVNLYDLEKAVEEWKNGNETRLRKILMPAGECLKKIMPVVQIREKLVNKLLNGAPISKDFLENKLPDSEIFAIFCGERFIGVYKKAGEKGILARPEFVFN